MRALASSMIAALKLASATPSKREASTQLEKGKLFGFPFFLCSDCKTFLLLAR